jgi:DNA-binding MarR family transcriptional regulator
MATDAITAVPTVSLDAYVLDVLMPDLVGHDHQPSALLVYLFLWRRTEGGAEPAEVRLRDLAEGTGLSKRAVQDAISRLETRRLLEVERASITAVLVFRVRRPWAERAAHRVATAG